MLLSNDSESSGAKRTLIPFTYGASGAQGPRGDLVVQGDVSVAKCCKTLNP